MARLQAFSAAGADCLYAPGLRGSGEVAAVVAAVHPKPVNVLATPSMTVSGLAALGARRISVGSGLARVAWGAFMAAARELADAGTFTGLGGAAPFAELNGLFE
jgi:2-methylisocitrate lyase-like PEP mutase family enzyme